MEDTRNYEKHINRTKRWMGAEFVVGIVFLIFLFVDGVDPLSLFIVIVTGFQLLYGVWKIKRLRNKEVAKIFD